MIDHITLHSKDIERAKAFYAAVLSPLGYQLAGDNTYGETRFVGFKVGDKTDTWFTNSKPATSPAHIAWVAATREQVDAFHKAALKGGGKDNGAPGVREHYHKNYYAAFAIDPDGNNIEAVCQAG